MVEREQLHTERDEKSSCCHDVLSAFLCLVLDGTLGEARLQKLESMLQLR